MGQESVSMREMCAIYRAFLLLQICDRLDVFSSAYTFLLRILSVILVLFIILNCLFQKTSNVLHSFLSKCQVPQPYEMIGRMNVFRMSNLVDCQSFLANNSFLILPSIAFAASILFSISSLLPTLFSIIEPKYLNK